MTTTPSTTTSANQETGLRRFSEHDLMFIAGVPAVYHCHHFNLFLDQTIDDALGPVAGTALRFQAARETAHELAANLAVHERATTPAERQQAALGAFSALGHGRLSVDAGPEGGRAHGDFLHYGFSWREKYGQVVRRKEPADAFAAGYAAAATEVAFGLKRESMQVSEQACLAARAPHCSFILEPAEQITPRPRPVREADYRANSRPVFGGQNENRIGTIVSGLRDFTAGVSSDERGLVNAFGVYVTVHLANYYNRISYEAVSAVERTAPHSLPVLEELLRESGHVCVFFTFGGILSSPEWEGLVGAPTNDPIETVTSCVAMARALGMGHWVIADIKPGERLVLRTPSGYEAAYYLARYGRSARANEYLLQGAAVAIAQLAHRLDWSKRPRFTRELYQTMFRGGTLPWRFEQTRSIAQGHSYSEVVVERAS